MVVLTPEKVNSIEKLTVLLDVLSEYTTSEYAIHINSYDYVEVNPSLNSIFIKFPSRKLLISMTYHEKYGKSFTIRDDHFNEYITFFYPFITSPPKTGSLHIEFHNHSPDCFSTPKLLLSNIAQVDRVYKEVHLYKTNVKADEVISKLLDLPLLDGKIVIKDVEGFSLDLQCRWLTLTTPETKIEIQKHKSVTSIYRHDKDNVIFFTGLKGVLIKPNEVTLSFTGSLFSGDKT